jgi:predicted nucleotidyltransferase
MPLSDEAIKSILSLVKGNKESLMIFGSAARGDMESHSDVDVLQVAKEKSYSYKVSRLSISVYNKRSLLALARQGSLFILHLIREGIIVRDEGGVIKECLSAYKPPKSYGPYRAHLRDCLGLLAVSEKEYVAKWREFNSIAIFLFRTLLYISAAEAGRPRFAARDIAREMGAQYVRCLEVRSTERPSWELFKHVSRLLERELDGEIVNEFGSTEAFICNVAETNPLVVNLGMRIMSDSQHMSDYGLFTLGPNS